MITVEQTVQTLNLTVEENGVTYVVQPVVQDIGLPAQNLRPIVTVFGNNFTLVKHPSNSQNSSVIQNNDIIIDGFRNNTTYWYKAICTNQSDINNDNSWNVIDFIDEITLV